jgi:ABC-type transport system involved in Fe-S cluster assembly fused permease/ATPase subunit
VVLHLHAQAVVDGDDLVWLEEGHVHDDAHHNWLLRHGGLPC